MGHALKPDFILRELEPSEAGFDYGLAMAHILQHLSQREVAGFLGYKSKSSIVEILSGQIPQHPQGERLYILYFEMFGEKPPLPNVRHSAHAMST